MGNFIEPRASGVARRALAHLLAVGAHGALVVGRDTLDTVTTVAVGFAIGQRENAVAWRHCEVWPRPAIVCRGDALKCCTIICADDGWIEAADGNHGHQITGRKMA